VDLAAHQRALRDLIETGSLPRGAEDDPYLREVAASRGLRVVREIVARWEAYDIRRSCPLTSAALDHAGRFEQRLRETAFGSSSAFAESRSALFLDHVAVREDGVISSIARFEDALLRARRGDASRYVIEWDRDPAPVLEGLAQGRWLADDAQHGRFRTVVSADQPGFVTVDAQRST
jgi:hypothetical protein